MKSGCCPVLKKNEKGKAPSGNKTSIIDHIMMDKSRFTSRWEPYQGSIT